MCVGGENGEREDIPCPNHVERSEDGTCDSGGGDGNGEGGERAGAVDDVEPAHAVCRADEDSRVGEGEEGGEETAGPGFNAAEEDLVDEGGIGSFPKPEGAFLLPYLR